MFVPRPPELQDGRAWGTNGALYVGEKWDPEAFKITNMPEANQYLYREYRAGWTL